MVKIQGRSNPCDWGVLAHSQSPTTLVKLANYAGPAQSERYSGWDGDSSTTRRWLLATNSVAAMDPLLDPLGIVIPFDEVMFVMEVPDSDPNAMHPTGVLVHCFSCNLGY